LILRVPGIGVKSAKLIVMSRRFGKITGANLKKMGVVMKKAQYFITCNELSVYTVNEASPEYVRRVLTEKKAARSKPVDAHQLSLIFE
jgi:predicted DNA-binding helix-hairpin-helix protein